MPGQNADGSDAPKSDIHDFEAETKTRIRRLYYRALNYLALYAFIIVVFGGAVLTDYFLFSLVAWLLREETSKYPVVALWFERAKIGLALLALIWAVVHGVMSTISQIKLDIAMSQEVEDI